jgi:hypothetical protein
MSEADFAVVSPHVTYSSDTVDLAKETNISLTLNALQPISDVSQCIYFLGIDAHDTKTRINLYVDAGDPTSYLVRDKMLQALAGQCKAIKRLQMAGTCSHLDWAIGGECSAGQHGKCLQCNRFKNWSRPDQILKIFDLAGHRKDSLEQ